MHLPAILSLASLLADPSQLAGHWSGPAATGAGHAQLDVALPNRDRDASVLAIGSWSVDDGPLAGAHRFSIVREDEHEYLLASDSLPLSPHDPGAGGGAYVRVPPDSALHFTRLIRAASEDDLVAQSEDVDMTLNSDMSMTLTLSRGRRWCDSGEGFQVCAPSHRQVYRLQRN